MDLLLRRRQMMNSGGGKVIKTGSLTVYPSSYDNVDISCASISNPSNAYGAASGSSSCTIYFTTGSEALTWVYFNFNTSSIPANATITSISCVARVSMQSGGTSYITNRGVVLCTGTTTISSSGNLTATSANRTLSVSTMPTRAEAGNLRVKMYGQRTTSNVTTSYYMRLYGVTLTIDYTYEEDA